MWAFKIGIGNNKTCHHRKKSRCFHERVTLTNIIWCPQVQPEPCSIWLQALRRKTKTAKSLHTPASEKFKELSSPASAPNPAHLEVLLRSCSRLASWVSALLLTPESLFKPASQYVWSSGTRLPSCFEHLHPQFFLYPPAIHPALAPALRQTSSAWGHTLLCHLPPYLNFCSP